jgi:hypothetical protein
MTSSTFGHEFRLTNDLFQSHHCICLAVSLMVVQVFDFRLVDSEKAVLGV